MRISTTFDLIWVYSSIFFFRLLGGFGGPGPMGKPPPPSSGLNTSRTDFEAWSPSLLLPKDSRGSVVVRCGEWSQESGTCTAQAVDVFFTNVARYFCS